MALSISSFGLLVLNICVWQNILGAEYCETRKSPAPHGGFELVYEWDYFNYTWTSPSHYASAVSKGQYIPENNVFTGIKIHNDRIYLSVPRMRKGIPATLNYVPQYSHVRNPSLTPFPSWATNDERNCDNLQSIQSMEIDTHGIMWVIDGVRINNFNKCPAKLVLLDLNNGGKLLHKYVFPNEIGLQDGGWLDDIVVDETDGGFAYITDHSDIDPGIIVYSKSKNRSWKLRDVTMFPEPNANNFVLENIEVSIEGAVDGIALSPKPRTNRERTLFYSSISGFNLYSIGTSLVKNEQLVKSGKWRDGVKTVGYKVGQSDGLMVDNKGNLFYTLMVQYGVGKWNINTDFSTARILYRNTEDLVWPDSFAMDQKGYLYLNTNNFTKYIDPNAPLRLSQDGDFRVYRLYTGTKSYLYN